MMDQIDDDVSMSSSEDEEDYSSEILKVDEYRNNIKINSEDYDSHINLINALRYSKDFDGANTARKEMNLHFPLSPEMWIEWANDERERTGDKALVYDIYRKAIEEYRSVDVWLELCQFSLGYFEDSSELRKIFEEAISQVGTQFKKGSLIWEMLMIYEKQVILNLLDGKAAEEQRNRIFKLYNRQLTVSLEDNYNIFEEFLEWNKTCQYPEEEIRAKFEQSNKVSESLRPFENEILEAVVDYAAKKTDLEQISKEESWLKYLSFAIKHMNKCDIVNLYERALTDLCLSQPIWSNYLSYLAKHFESDGEKILSTCRRAIRNNKCSLDLRLSLIRNMERYNSDADEIRESFNAVFRSKLSDQNPFLPLWQSYIDFERRYLDVTKSRDLTVIRGLFDRLIDLENYLDYDPSCLLIKYWAMIEARYSDSMDKSRELWSFIRKSLGNNNAALWLENLEFERRFGDFDSCKRLMSNAVNCFVDYPEYMFERVMRWVSEDGHIDSYFLFTKKIESQQLKINEKRLKEAAIVKSERSDKKLKRKFEEKNSSVPKAKIAKTAETKFEEVPKLSKPPYKSIDKSEPVETCEERSVFVSNLNFKVTEKELTEMFGKCGKVEDVRLIKKLTGQSKGYAYIQFTDQSAVEEAMKLEREFLMERPMYVNLCDPSKRHSFGYKIGEIENNKLFVKNLPKTVTKTALEEIFKKYPQMKEVRLVTTKSGLPKGIAYVEYEDENSASRALVGTDGLEVGENKIEVLLSKTPQRSAGDGPRPIGALDNEKGFGPEKAAAFLVPRAVNKAPTTQKKLIHHDRVTSGPEKTEVGTEMKSNADFKKFLR